MTGSPRAHLRRSFVHRQLSAAGAQFRDIGGEMRADRFGSLSDDRRAAENLGIADCSLLPRTGFKGPGSAAWLEKQGARFGAAPNRAYVQPDGTLIARLSPGEFFVLQPPGSGPAGADRCRSLEESWSLDTAEGCYRVPRADSHAWFLITGTHAPALFAKLCGVDLRAHRFDDLAVAQTSLARLSAIVIRNAIGPLPAYHVLADSASAEYLYDVFRDAMAEFGGRPIGVAALAAGTNS